MLISLRLTAVIALAAILGGCTVHYASRTSVATGTRYVEVPNDPPPLKVIVNQTHPQKPNPNAVWVPGHWKWEGSWVWNEGSWQTPSEPNQVWTPPVVVPSAGGSRHYYPGYFRDKGDEPEPVYKEPGVRVVGINPNAGAIARGATAGAGNNGASNNGNVGSSNGTVAVNPNAGAIARGATAGGSASGSGSSTVTVNPNAGAIARGATATGNSGSGSSTVNVNPNAGAIARGAAATGNSGSGSSTVNINPNAGAIARGATATSRGPRGNVVKDVDMDVESPGERAGVQPEDEQMEGGVTVRCELPKPTVRRGTIADIHGSGFGSDPTVKLGTTRLPIVSHNTTAIRVRIPRSEIGGTVTVTVGNETGVCGQLKVIR